MRITRLSEGVDASATLLPAALARSYEVLSEYRTLMDEYGVERGLLVATSAVRDARNGQEFLETARKITGVEGRLLSGAEEAAYSYAGASADLEPDDRATLIVDIGGGSTELAVRLNEKMFSFSMQLGCVRVTERALGREVVTPQSAAAARTMISAELDRAWAAVPQFDSVVGRVRMVGLAGTVATLAQLDARLDAYDRDVVHHRNLSRRTVVQWRDRLAGEPPAARLARPGMAAGREDVLAAGLFVLDAVMERFGVDELVSSESDILDGIVAALLRDRSA